MKNFFAKIVRFWNQERSLTVTLAVICLYIFVCVPLVDLSRGGRIFLRVAYTILLFAGILSVVRQRKYLVVIAFWTIVGVTISWAGEFDNSVAVAVAHDISSILYNLFFAVLMLIKTFQPGEVTYHRIIGAIIVYLAAGLLFTYSFHAIYLLEGLESFNNIKSGNLKEFLYFSFTTLTTAGYGDVTPVVPIARSLSNVETLIGQLYPAILIARLVSLEVESSHRTKEKQKGGVEENS